MLDVFVEVWSVVVDLDADDELHCFVPPGVPAEEAKPLGDGFEGGDVEDGNGKAVADGDDVGQGAGGRFTVRAG